MRKTTRRWEDCPRQAGHSPRTSQHPCAWTTPNSSPHHHWAPWPGSWPCLCQLSQPFGASRHLAALMLTWLSAAQNRSPAMCVSPGHSPVGQDASLGKGQEAFTFPSCWKFTCLHPVVTCVLPQAWGGTPPSAELPVCAWSPEHCNGPFQEGVLCSGLQSHCPGDKCPGLKPGCSLQGQLR